MQTKFIIEFNIKALLERCGKSPIQIAEMTGLHVRTVRDLVSGRYERIGLDTITRLCAALDVEPGDLFKRVENNEVRHVSE
jgi:DNA-binding Xre family transcriptional regulator